MTTIVLIWSAVLSSRVAQAAGIDRLALRKDWPLDVLKKVLGNLMSEIPRNLLEQQIWCGSASSGDWWHRHKEYSRSTAVMSMVG